MVRPDRYSHGPGLKILVRPSTFGRRAWSLVLSYVCLQIQKVCVPVASDGEATAAGSGLLVAP